MSSAHAELIEMLLTRLERVPADSFWAHRASGVRGSLLEALELAEAGKPLDAASLSHLTRVAFRILELAAGEKSQAGHRRTHFGAGRDHLGSGSDLRSAVAEPRNK